MKKANPGHDVTVLERNAPDATFGWGVVFSEETLGALRDADRETFDEITDTFATWDAIDIRFRGRTVRSRGHAFSAIARKRLLNILQRRCAALGVEVRFETEVPNLSTLEPADLLVGADGVNSTIRRLRQDAFRPSLEVHSAKYVWFGTDLVFTAFTFIFRENEHGLFQVHAYPFDARTSTFIVECPGEVWQRAGLDGASEEESIAYCERLFAEDLAGHSLLSNRSVWSSFVTVRNASWHYGNVVLLGDAAHTAHFTIGSGTKLAMEDAVALADALKREPSDVLGAIARYEMERQPVVERFQQAAVESSSYFESVRRYARFEPIQFAFNLLTRSGRITHLNLELRDPAFVREVDGWYGSAAAHDTGRASVRLAPAPMFAPVRLRGVDVTNRVALSPSPLDAAVDGVVTPAHREVLAGAAESGAGLVLTELTAVSPGGRITSGSPGMYDGERHGSAWSQLVADVHERSASRIGLRLGHAGRRGATRPRGQGVDRALAVGAWPLISASPIPFTRRNQVPSEATSAELDRITRQFVASTEWAAIAGFDMLELDMGSGYLLGSFLSPLTNHRSGRYGGPPADRMRFPLEVMDAVRSAWPIERPLAARITAADLAPGGSDVEDAIALALALKARGCDLIHVVAGQTVEHDHPDFGRSPLVPYADRIRNESGIPTLVGGNLTTADQVNTILAAGRADLCLLEPRAIEFSLRMASGS
jgi:anthraniloyl-CoA monooxygenase